MSSLYELVENFEIVAILFFFGWAFSWGKNTFGSAKVGVIFAAIVTFLTVYTFREIIWIGVVLFLFSTFGKELFSKMTK